MDKKLIKKRIQIIVNIIVYYIDLIYIHRSTFYMDAIYSEQYF